MIFLEEIILKPCLERLKNGFNSFSSSSSKKLVPKESFEKNKLCINELEFSTVSLLKTCGILLPMTKISPLS